MIVLMFILFNVWIQCSNRQISREIIHPWLNCRCSLNMFLCGLPFILTFIEFFGILFYFQDFKKISIPYKVLMGLSLLFAFWF